MLGVGRRVFWDSDNSSIPSFEQEVGLDHLLRSGITHSEKRERAKGVGRAGKSESHAKNFRVCNSFSLSCGCRAYDGLKSASMAIRGNLYAPYARLPASILLPSFGKTRKGYTTGQKRGRDHQPHHMHWVTPA